MNDHEDIEDDHTNKFNWCFNDDEIEYEGHFCVEDTNTNADFTGDNLDYQLLSDDAPAMNEQKEHEKEINLGFNVAQVEAHATLHNELNHLRKKIKQACQKDVITFEDLVDLKHGPESEIARTFLTSNVKSLKSNYDKVCQFLGTFFFCSWLSFTPKEALMECVDQCELKNKLLSYEECKKNVG